MEYTILKLHFKTALHIGDKRLTDSEITIGTDTVFSALCHEAIAQGQAKLEQLVNLAKTNQLIISDALPFIETDYYIPKPIAYIKRNGDAEDYGNKKAFKKLKYLPISRLDEFISGRFDAVDGAKDFAELGKAETRTNVNISDDTGPYHVGTFTFSKNAGLYIIIGYTKGFDLVADLFKALSYSGIGGRRSSGLGKFELTQCSMDGELLAHLTDKTADRQMTLSGAMAKADELKNSLMGAEYLLKQRSGFVSSASYHEKQVKKRDFYMFTAGSCFTNIFEGDVFDVSQGGAHPVYRYAKPIFMGVRV